GVSRRRGWRASGIRIRTSGLSLFHPLTTSCPDLFRASTRYRPRPKPPGVDGRVKPGHDEEKLLRSSSRLMLLDRAPQAFGRQRHLDMADAERLQRVDDGVGDRRRRADRAGLAAAFDAERVVG